MLVSFFNISTNAHPSLYSLLLLVILWSPSMLVLLARRVLYKIRQSLVVIREFTR
jgi:hypothetical protein